MHQSRATQPVGFLLTELTFKRMQFFAILSGENLNSECNIKLRASRAESSRVRVPLTG